MLSARRVSRAGALVLTALLAWHLWLISIASQGRESFEAVSAQAPSAAWLLPIALAALLGHVLGALRAERAQASLAPTQRSTRWRERALDGPLLRRATGVLALPFVVWHLEFIGAFASLGSSFSTPGGQGIGPSVSYDLLCAKMSSTLSGVPLTALTHLLGTSLLAVHLALGIVAVCTASAGTSPLRRPRVAWALAASGAALLLGVGASAVLRFATGSGAIFVGFG